MVNLQCQLMQIFIRGFRTIRLCLLVLSISILISACNLIGSAGFLIQKQRFDNPQIVHPPYTFPESGTKYPASIEALRSIQGINAVLILHKDQITLEWYRAGYNLFSSFNIKSLSKSILSVVTGIAIEQHYIEGPDQRLNHLLPKQYRALPNTDKISLHHLLTMSAGFRYSENNDNHVYASNDWSHSILSLPLEALPGARFRYGTPQSHLISHIIQHTTGDNTLEYTQKVLFQPMGIDIRRWDKSPDGIFFGGSDMFMTVRDIAAFGQLIRHKGRSGDKQIVSESWLETSIYPYFNQVQKDWNYGYLWWLRSIDNVNVIAARGYGEQNLFIIPELDLVIVTAGSTPLFYDHLTRSELIENLLSHIIQHYKLDNH